MHPLRLSPLIVFRIHLIIHFSFTAIPNSMSLWIGSELCQYTFPGRDLKVNTENVHAYKHFNINPSCPCDKNNPNPSLEIRT